MTAFTGAGCPGPCANSFQECVDCQACRPGLPERVQLILEVKYHPRSFQSFQEILRYYLKRYSVMRRSSQGVVR